MFSIILMQKLSKRINLRNFSVILISGLDFYFP